jgi:hypothetical protein
VGLAQTPARRSAWRHYHIPRNSSQIKHPTQVLLCILSEEPGLYDHARTILQSMLEDLKPAKEKLVLEIDDNSEWREAA